MNEVLSDTIEIKNKSGLSTEYIEEILDKHFNEVVRWAIVNIEGEKLKVNVSYRN